MSAPVRARNYSPSVFSAELAAFGISFCEKSIRKRCNLPETDPLHIPMLKGFPGRKFIPESCLFKLCGVAEVRG